VTESSDFSVLKFFDSPPLPELVIKTGGDIFDHDFYPGFSVAEPASQSVLIASRNRPVHLYSCVSGLPVSAYTAHSFTEQIVHPLSIKFSPQSRTIMGGFAQSTVRVWDVQRPGRQAQDLVFTTRKGQGTQKGIISSVCFANEDSFFAGSYSKDIFMYDIRDKKQCMRIGSDNSAFGGVVQMDFLTDRNMLVSAHRMHNYMHCWDVRNPETPVMDLPRISKNHQRTSHSIVSDRYVFAGDHFGDLTVFDLQRDGEIVLKQNVSRSPLVSVSAVLMAGDQSDVKVACGYGCRTYPGVPDDSDVEDRSESGYSTFRYRLDLS
jgi:WD40 repeat protein